MGGEYHVLVADVADDAHVMALGVPARARLGVAHAPPKHGLPVAPSAGSRSLF